MSNDKDVGAMCNAPRTCVSCDSPAVHLSKEEQVFPYGEGKDQVMLRATVPVWTCRNCDEQFTDGDAEEIRHEVICRYLNRLTPKELRGLRASYGDSQEQWAKRTRLGLASIKRWETGNKIQNEATDMYLWLLLDPTIAELVGGRGSNKTPRQSSPVFRTPVSAEAKQQARIFLLHTRQSPTNRRCA